MMRVIIVGFVVLAVVGGISKACGGGDEEPSSASPQAADSQVLDREALSVCEQFVEPRLRAPATADFAGSQDATITHAGPEYVVRSFVDAENGFGALIRTDWTCVVRYSSAGQEWTLVSLTGLG